MSGQDSMAVAAGLMSGGDIGGNQAAVASAAMGALSATPYGAAASALTSALSGGPSSTATSTQGDSANKSSVGGFNFKSPGATAGLSGTAIALGLGVLLAAGVVVYVVARR